MLSRCDSVEVMYSSSFLAAYRATLLRSLWQTAGLRGKTGEVLLWFDESERGWHDLDTFHRMHADAGTGQRGLERQLRDQFEEGPRGRGDGGRRGGGGVFIWGATADDVHHSSLVSEELRKKLMGDPWRGKHTRTMRQVDGASLLAAVCGCCATRGSLSTWPSVVLSFHLCFIQGQPCSSSSSSIHHCEMVNSAPSVTSVPLVFSLCARHPLHALQARVPSSFYLHCTLLPPSALSAA